MAELNGVEAAKMEQELKMMAPYVSIFLNNLQKVIADELGDVDTQRSGVIDTDVTTWNEDKEHVLLYDDFTFMPLNVAKIASGLGIQGSDQVQHLVLTLVNRIQANDLSNPYFRQIMGWYVEQNPDLINFIFNFVKASDIKRCLMTGEKIEGEGLSPTKLLRREILFNFGTWRLQQRLPVPLVCYSIPVTYDSGLKALPAPAGLGALLQYVPTFVRNYAVSSCVANITAIGIGDTTMILMKRGSNKSFLAHPSFTHDEMYRASTLNNKTWGVYSYNERNLLWFSMRTLTGMQILRTHHGEKAHIVSSTVRPVNYRYVPDKNGKAQPQRGPASLASTHSIGFAADSAPATRTKSWVSSVRKEIRNKGPLLTELLDAGIGGIGTYLSGSIFVHLDSRTTDLPDLSGKSAFSQSHIHMGMNYSVWET